MRKVHKKRHFVIKPGSFLVLILPVILITLVFSLAGDKNEQEAAAPEVTPIEIVQPAPTIISLPSEKIPASRPTPVPTPKVIERYAEIIMTEGELKELAEIIYHEARGESIKGQQAVAEVVFNRVIADNWPDTVHDVLHQDKQFSTLKMLGTAEPRQEQYDAINLALYGETILPADVVFFSQKGENDRIWGSIENHVFCYQYD